MLALVGAAALAAFILLGSVSSTHGALRPSTAANVEAARVGTSALHVGSVTAPSNTSCPVRGPLGGLSSGETAGVLAGVALAGLIVGVVIGRFAVPPRPALNPQPLPPGMKRPSIGGGGSGENPSESLTGTPEVDKASPKLLQK